MIDKNKVEELVNEKLDEKMFLVEVLVSKSNLINIFVDSFEGLTIQQCKQISRHVEQGLDRDIEDFELEVSSPGLSEGFKVQKQYLKNIGREIEILTSDGIKLIGELVKANDLRIVIKTTSREKVEGHKKKQLIVNEHVISYDEIKTAKVVISFK